MQAAVKEISSPSPASLSRAFELVLCLLCAACQPVLVNPAAPETDGIEASYDDPTGVLLATDLPRIQELVEEQGEALALTDSLSIVEEVFSGARDEDLVAPGGDDVDPTAGARLLAVARIQHICRGPEGDDVIDAEQNGKLTMTLKGSPRGIFPTAWGSFDACVDHVGDTPFTIDGSYSITLRKLGKNRTLLFVFKGSIESGDTKFEIGFDFRIGPRGLPELRISGSEGDVIVTPTSDAQLEVRDSDGVWLCDPLSRECTNMETGDVKGAGATDE
jgi:hypothetical protein